MNSALFLLNIQTSYINDLTLYINAVCRAVDYARSNNIPIFWIKTSPSGATTYVTCAPTYATGSKFCPEILFLINEKDDIVFTKTQNSHNYPEIYERLTELNIEQIYIGGYKKDIYTSTIDFSANYSVKVLQDIIILEEPYNSLRDINYENRILKKLLQFDNVSLTSTNILSNIWGCGDVKLVDLDLHENMFENIKTEVQFREMISQGNPVPRLVAIQFINPEKQLFDFSGNEKTKYQIIHPVYRHPNDIEPENVSMTKYVLDILKEVEEKTGITGLNHVLIQLYRDGTDHISAHSDKTLDIDLNTPIINVSLGFSRIMTLQSKRNTKIKEQIPLNNSTAVVFGLKTNKEWYHEIKKDMTRPVSERISLTFRKINTYLYKINSLSKSSILVGQGSPYKTIEDIDKITITSEQTDPKCLLYSFGNENKDYNFNWELNYGNGFLIYQNHSN